MCMHTYVEIMAVHQFNLWVIYYHSTQMQDWQTFGAFWRQNMYAAGVTEMCAWINKDVIRCNFSVSSNDGGTEFNTNVAVCTRRLSCFFHVFKWICSLFSGCYCKAGCPGIQQCSPRHNRFLYFSRQRLHCKGRFLNTPSSSWSPSAKFSEMNNIIGGWFNHYQSRLAQTHQLEGTVF